MDEGKKCRSSVRKGVGRGMEVGEVMERIRTNKKGNGEELEDEGEKEEGR